MSVRINSIHLRRLRGTGAALHVEHLAPDINVIHGPNGVGKSTLALALQEALWPGSTELDRPTLDARLDADGTPWNVSIEAGYAVHDGPQGGRPDFGSPDRRPRYLLALHDLVMSESGTDAEFAARVLRESLGGHDLDAAATALGFAAYPTESRKLKTGLKAARQALEEARARARGLEKSRQALTQLETERRDADRARAEAAVVERVLAVVRARSTLQAAMNTLEEIPVAAGLLRGNEQEALQNLRSRESGLVEKIKKAEHDVARLDRLISEKALAGDPVDATRRGHWKSLVKQVEDCERDLNEYRRARIEAEDALQVLESRLSDTAGAMATVSLSRDMARVLGRLFRDWINIEGQGALLEQQRRAHEVTRLKLDEHIRTGGGMPGDALRMALRQLEAWLRAPEPDRPHERAAVWVVALAVLAVVTGVVSALFVGPAFLLASVLAAVLFYLYRQGRRPPEITRRPDIERLWNETGVPAPASWTKEDVIETHKALSEQLAKGERIAEDGHALDVRMQGWEEDRKTWRAERIRALSELAALGQKIGWPLTEKDAAEDGDLMAQGLWLIRLSEDLVAHGDLQAQLTKAAAAQESSRKELHRLLGDLVELTNALGIDAAPGSAGAAREVLDLLENRIQELETAQQERTAFMRRLETEWRPDLEEVKGEMAQLFAGVGLSPGDDVGLSRLLELRDTWIAASEAKRVAEHDVQRTERALSTSPPPDDMKENVESLLVLEEAELDRRKRHLEEQAASHDELTERMERIKAELGVALRDQDVARAVAARDVAEDALDSAKAQNERAIIGSEVVRFVREQTVQGTLPQVFVRARNLLAGFTAGALELDLDLESQEPRFLAKTDGSLRARPVAELSVGERVQLLMAVRMAFLEQEEASALPLILDEALGTTDDERSRAVLSALMELASRGRQLFYFTAQSDEVGKWLEMLQKLPGSAEERVTDLAAVRMGTAKSAAPLPSRTGYESQPAVPAPRGHDHDSYGQVLGVPGIRPHEEDVGAVHIWHVLDSAEDVYRLLVRRVQTIGQFRVLASGGHQATGSEADRSAVYERIDVLEDALTLWKRGRGRPLTRDVLEAAPGVTRRKLPEVWDLARNKDFRAAALVDGLEAGEVKHFHGDKREELRAYLEENGFISREESLSASDAALQLQRRHPGASMAYVERVVAVLWRDERQS